MVMATGPHLRKVKVENAAKTKKVNLEEMEGTFADSNNA